MAIMKKSDQFIFTGRGPIDAKSLVRTYADLLSVDTWTLDGSLVAYNGMIVAVWLDKVDDANNGIYYLFDPAVTSALKKPDVTNTANWHKLSGSVDVSGIQDVITELEKRVAALETEDRTHTYGYRTGFPPVEKAQLNHIYIAEDQHRSYIFSNGQYIPLGDSIYEYWDIDGDNEPDVRVINGGSAE